MAQSQSPRLKRIAWWAIRLALPVVLIGGAIAYLARPVETGSAAHAAEAVQWWTCSMHPQIRLPNPGLCPICNMELIPLSEASQAGGPREFSASPEAIALMSVETAPVERRPVAVEVRMVGKVDYDETRLAYITARVGGRLDRLFVDYTGVAVRKGDHLAEIYSPELYSAQQELLTAVQAVADTAASGLDIVRQTARATVESAREKLRLWGLTDGQIAEIEQRGKLADHVTLYAPVGGIVIHKSALQGDYVDVGRRIYTIADLSQVWVKLDAYESDLPWLRYGQTVRFSSVSSPGERFEGVISFIDPVLSEKTRTVKVRVDVPNADGRLKPEMFVHAVAQAEVSADGQAILPDLAGKWISPMHPNIVKDGPGDCDVCGMPLVPAESLGLVASTQDATPPLVIPATAPLVTGTRAVVYVEKPGAEQPTFEGRQIVLGPRAGDYYVVAEGLAEGERVAVRGNFLIDSALQIQARPSMMSPEGGVAPAGHNHGGPAATGHEGQGPDPSAPAAHPASGSHAGDDAQPMATSQPEKSPQWSAQLQAVLDAYCAMQTALAQDALDPARTAAEQLRAAVAAVETDHLSPQGRQRWSARAAELTGAADRAKSAGQIAAMRVAFAPLSEALIATARQFPLAGETALYVLHCPMALDNKGARWLQRTAKVHNPYFGAAMLGCGSVVEVLPASSSPSPPSGGDQ